MPYTWPASRPRGQCRISLFSLMGTIPQMQRTAESPSTVRHEIKSLMLRCGKLAGQGEPVANALGVLCRYGGIDEAHHKAWVIDQAIRHLLGSQRYAEWVEQSKTDGYEVDEGIAP